MNIDIESTSPSVVVEESSAAGVSGTVYWRAKGGERAVGAVVRASREGEAAAIQVTDDDGDYAFEGMAPGLWQLVTLHEAGKPREAQEVNLDAGESDRVDLFLFPYLGTHDEAAGWRLFRILVGALLVLFVVYVLLHYSIITPPAPRFAPWTVEPWWFLEVLFWALAGILAKKIFDVSYYVRRRRFYREGTIMHIGHIVAVPLLVLVVLFLLSQVSLTLAVGTSELQLDLDNPLLLVAVAFLLALDPWGLLGYLTGVGQRIIGEPEA